MLDSQTSDPCTHSSTVGLTTLLKQFQHLSLFQSSSRCEKDHEGSAEDVDTLSTAGMIIGRPVLNNAVKAPLLDGGYCVEVMQHLLVKVEMERI